jgi:signal transduction histidine kinase
VVQTVSATPSANNSGVADTARAIVRVVILILRIGAPGMVTDARRAAAVAVMSLMMSAVAALAAGAESKAIVVLQTYGHNAPGRVRIDSALVNAFRQAADINVELYIETLDPNRFAGAEQAQRTRAYLRAKYADKRIAVVAAVYDRALAFVLDRDDPLFPGVPVAAVVAQYPQSFPQQVSTIWSGNLIGDTVALALRLRPRTQQIAFVDGALPIAGSNAVYEEGLSEIAAVAPDVRVISLRDLPLDEVLTRLERLPPESIIVVSRQLIGRGGEPIANADGVSALARGARAPIYATSEIAIGAGAVGGMVVSLESEAQQLAALALRLAADPSLHVAPAREIPAPFFDWRELRRWGISETLLPAGSTVLFRQLSAWDQYKFYILGGGVLLVLQSAMIAALLIQGARRRRTEVALGESEFRFRVTAERNQDLAGRLISAQEEERTRIARDLHDDVSQQLAGVGIMLSALKRKVGQPALQPDVEHTLAVLQDRTMALADAIRTLSHQLHPSVLQHVGLVEALRHHCAELEQQHHVKVIFSAGDNLDPLISDVALCLFRVAQETLANALRHARASTIHMRLVLTNDCVTLSVVDDGIGFVVGERTRTGLGLRSVDERVRLAQGDVSVESSPGRGTKVLVRIPVSVAATRRDPV